MHLFFERSSTHHNFASDRDQLHILHPWHKFGDMVFTSLKVAHGKFYFLERHLKRLGNGAQYLYGNTLTAGLGDRIRQMLGAWTDTIEQNCEYALKIIVVPADDDKALHICLQFEKLVVGDDKSCERLESVCLEEFRGPTFVKTNNYIWRQKAYRDRGKNFSDILLINSAGEILESRVSNIFIYQDAVWKTPPIQPGVLDGITRKEIIKFLGPNVEITPVYLRDICQGDEAFICNAVKGLRKIEKIDNIDLDTIKSTMLMESLNDYFQANLRAVYERR